MSDGIRGRRLFWWRMPVKADSAADAGRKMMMTVVVWFVGIAMVAAVVAIIVALG